MHRGAHGSAANQNGIHAGGETYHHDTDEGIWIPLTPEIVGVPICDDRSLDSRDRPSMTTASQCQRLRRLHLCWPRAAGPIPLCVARTQIIHFAVQFAHRAPPSSDFEAIYIEHQHRHRMVTESRGRPATTSERPPSKGLGVTGSAPPSRQGPGTPTPGTAGRVKTVSRPFMRGIHVLPLIAYSTSQSASGSTPIDALSQKLILRMRARFGEAAADVSNDVMHW